MKIYVDLPAITQIFEQAAADNRNLLFEYEVYELNRLLGAETVPRYAFIAKGARLNHAGLDMGSDRVVIKIVSPWIIHKSDVGGVRIVDAGRDSVLSTIRAMHYEVPERYAELIAAQPDYAPERYRRQAGNERVQAIAADVRGVMVCQYMSGVSHEFGNELILGLRRAREFGMILNAGLGGADTELYAANLKYGKAMVSASTAMVDADHFFQAFTRTIAYQKLAGLSRGQKRVVSDEQLKEAFAAFQALGNHFSPANPQAPFVIEELEINPFAFDQYLMIPLDGFCRFSKPARHLPRRPITRLENMLHPKHIGIMGVSSKSHNFGRIILDNIRKNGFALPAITVIHPTVNSIDGVRAVPDLQSLPRKLDLLIVAVGAQRVPEIVDQVIAQDLAEAVMLIPGGLGEKMGSAQTGADLARRIHDAHQRPGGGPLFLGGNCLGILSHPGRYDSLFVPEDRLPKRRGNYVRHSALISQSGAYMISRMSNLRFLDPAYAVSIGNQLDVTAGDMLEFINQRPEIDTVAVYMEGFQDLDGLRFAQEARTAVKAGKAIIFYKAGRTREGKTASSGHTASLAGDYTVCASCMAQAGAMVTDSFSSFEGLFQLSATLHGKIIRGNRLAAVSNAGYEAVGIADNIIGRGFTLSLSELSPGGAAKLAAILKTAGLDALVDVRNPMDLTPMADEGVYESVIQVMLQDPAVDAVIAALIPLTPFIQAQPDNPCTPLLEGTTSRIHDKIARLAREHDKPLIVVLDAGAMYDGLAVAFVDSGVPVFRSADQAVSILGQYIQNRLNNRGNQTGN